jgi:hypothetical protein
MIDYLNPFEYEAANKLKLGQILEFYIEDFNYSRFVRSKRNVFLVGERGTGKTMTLLFNSLRVQLKKAEDEGRSINLDLVCIYVPCNTPLTHKTEYTLMDDFQGKVISEHFLVVPILFGIAETLAQIPNLLDGADAGGIQRELEYILGISLPTGVPLFEALKLVVQKENHDAQVAINAKKLEVFYENARSFSTGVLPLLSTIRKIPKLKESHFVLMLDDAHDLNELQVRTLNSWIAYRDNALFSFKVATTKVGRPAFLTATGGAILEGHDFTVVDMELPYQNRYSNFGKLAREIVRKRLEKIGMSPSTPDEFFPTSVEFERDLKACEERVRKEAEVHFPQGTAKQIGDYVYKRARAAYFRERSVRANRPPYSGFDTLVHISTGVIRNLLEPCYWMYDKMVSEMRSRDQKGLPVEEIPASVQTEILIERSKKKWDWIREGFDKSIEGCSRVDAERVYKLFDNLAVLFRERLLHHNSEPRAIAFTISDIEAPEFNELIRLLQFARKAQILYTYASSAKDSGRREVYYVPNRILWPDRGLDPHGQHARVSIKARDLWAAAVQNRRIPFDPSDGEAAHVVHDEGDLFHAQQ